MSTPQHNINERVRHPNILLIDENGNRCGEMSSWQALNLAREKGFDLVEMNKEASPPICKLMDYGKWKYEQSKNGKGHKPQASETLKEVALSVTIGDHDLETKARNAQEWLNKGFTVSISLRFRGREMEHRELGLEKVKIFLEKVSAYKTDKAPLIDGKFVNAIIRGTNKPQQQQQSA